MTRKSAAALALVASVSHALASDEGQIATARVSVANYRHYLDDKLYTHMGDNRGFGPEHDLARDNIYEILSGFDLEVTLEPFVLQGWTFYNVVGTKIGTTYPDEEYVIGAHYDSVNNPGADDNASGVALVLEAARVLSDYDCERTIRFVAFDREEQGLFGATAYVETHTGDDILGMISADMVSWNSGEGIVEVWAGRDSLDYKLAVAAAVETYGDGLVPELRGSTSGSDHAAFAGAGYHACLIEEDWGNPFYHTPYDHVDQDDYIDYEYAARITRAAVGFLVDHAGVHAVFPDGDFDQDFDVDLDDYDQFLLCFTGSSGGPVGRDCLRGDFDLDNDLDCIDWEEFALLWTEPENPAPPGACACLAAEAAQADPGPFLKNRYISFVPGNPGHEVAIRVELASLYDPDPPLESVNPDFSAFEGEVRWVGEPMEVSEFDEVEPPFQWPTFIGAMLKCEPHYMDWSSIGLLHVFGAEIMPDSIYDVRVVHQSCDELLDDELVYSDPLAVFTSRWGDVAEPFFAPDENSQPDFLDISGVVDKFTGEVEPSKVRVQVQGNVLPVERKIDFKDISLAVDAFGGEAYPHEGPCPCPSTVTCPGLDACGRCD